ncbi:DUF2314 domain-containing protein [Chryseobacterium indologenes]|uniref:DUF2314 domain-containing protein n=2 Tax=Chryseobacterium TaxID=59732 RepID=A0A3G6RSJ1_CHRLC|nr:MULTISPECIES: DUF2314 domain-containing protein [Bacteroidota]AZA84536.1 DUF2314 domain-containing protein [Chryseobacterium lactis]AZB04924.1 DUF2314 domain-containing protein [Chryseobacterium lactis]KMQ64403.1 hypothetical protein ACM46_08965 [Chryseobacterium angstadtii]MBF6643661.1 DUF2314 domain-containing protein [Chryseobacterium indologenes]PNW14655.1 DUF2314 domain-containing protein [Chryseobacterium lactis]
MDNHITIEVDDKFIYNLYKASSTLWYFDQLIAGGFTGYNSIKFKDKNDVFVWLENIEIEGKYYKGVLAETGQPEIVLRKESVDWLLIDNQRLIGGYTIRHYYNMLSEDERVNFEIYCGYRIDHGNDFFRPDRSTPEGAIITLENFYNENNMEGILSCKDFYLEAENVMQEHNMDWDSEIHSKVVSVLRVSLLEDLENKGFPNFETIERVFNLIERRKDQELIEETLYYPDGFITVNKFWVGLTKDNGWKVLNLVE